MKNHLLNILSLCFLSASASYAQNPQALMDSIITNNIFESERIGGAGAESFQYMHFKDLTEMLSKQEIKGLVTHKNGVLRMYAATYLIEEQGEDPVEIFLRELRNGERIETLNGCIGDYEYTSDLVYFSYRYKEKAKAEKISEMDSIVVSANYKISWRLYSKVLGGAGFSETLLPQIETLGFENNNPYAIGYLTRNYPEKYTEKANMFYLNIVPKINFDKDDETSMALFTEFVELMLQTGDKKIQDIAVEKAKDSPYAKDPWFINTFEQYGIKL
jgi:hypothetical protein